MVDKIRCPVCEASAETSTVDMHTAVGGFNPIAVTEDAEGRLHFHDTSEVTTNCSCSNGHTWTVTEKTPCPVEGCTWSPAGD